MPIQFYGVGMQAANAAPIALIVPQEQRSVVGASVSVDGRASYDPDNDPLTHTWVFVETPIGSELSDADLTPIDTAGSVVSFSPDVTGTYIVGLSVSDGQFSSSQVEGVVNIGLVQSPACTDILPDGKFFFRVLSDFWEKVEYSDSLPIMWSAYMQMAAGQLLDTFQANYEKSIKTVQEEWQRRWLGYEPKLELEADDCYLVLGNQLDGVSASTGPVGEPIVGVLLSATELHVLQGSVKDSLVGSLLRVLTSSGLSVGDYTIAKVGRGYQGYVISKSSPFPGFAGDTLGAAADLAMVKDSDVVRSPSTNFSTIVGLGPGDAISIPSGANAGYYLIEAVGVAGGLPDNQSLQVDRVAVVSGTFSFTLFNAVDALILPAEETTFTDSVAIPFSEADLSVLQGRALIGNATIQTAKEIIVGSQSVFDEAIGKHIEVSGPQSSGSFRVGAVNESGTGYLIDRAFFGPFPHSASFRLPFLGSEQGRIAVVNGRTHTVKKVKIDSNQPPAPLGPGPLSLVTLEAASAVDGLSSAEWRIPATLVSETQNFEELGVRGGDLLWVTVVDVETGARSEVRCSVVGADGFRLGFELGVDAVLPGAVLEPSDEDKVQLAEDLFIDGASLAVDGSLDLTGDALVLDSALRDIPFAQKYHNLPIRSTTQVRVADRTFQLHAKELIRNNSIPLDDRTVSIPCLKEYVGTVVAADNGDGTFGILTRDGSRTLSDHEPISLTENRDYTVEGETDLWGRDGETLAGSSVFTSAAGYFLSKGVEIGDILEVGTLDHYIVQVLSETQLQAVVKTTGAVFGRTQSALQYQVRRVVKEKTLRFVPSLFTPADPAPDRLWAEVTFLDNNEAVENNFGLMVSLKAEDLTDSVTSSTTYREAVMGLMYAWANGPSVANLRLGAHILLGLPVADVYGEILSIDDSFQVHPVTGDDILGRMLIADIDEETGEPTGITRTYVYPSDSRNTLEEFAGLAINPETGRGYQVGDLVERFAILSNGVLIEDYLNSPIWWEGRSDLHELQKFHTWSFRASIDVIDLDDLNLALQFAKTMDPSWVDVRARAVKPLADDITITDVLTLHGSMYFYDDPFGSIEATAMLDDYNGSSYSLHQLGVGPLSSRMMFAGVDLQTPAGGAGPLSFTSARGGFVTPLVDADHAEPMVRGGDLLRVQAGPNVGWYDVDSVTDDNTVVVVQQTAYSALPSPAMPGVQLGTDQKFFIFRVSRNPIVQGSSLTLSAVTDIVTETSGLGFVTEGVAVNDKLVVDTGASRGVYEILEIPYTPYPRTQMKVAPQPPAASVGARYRIIREVLLLNPIFDSTFWGVTAWTLAGSNTVTSAGADFDLQLLWTGDWLVLEGAAAGRYEILDVLSATQLFVRPALPANSLGVDYTITRDGLSDGNGLRINQVLDFFPSEYMELAIIRPRSVVVTAPDVVATDRFTSPSVNFGAVPVLAGDFIEVGNPSALTDVNSGVFEVDSVSGGDIFVLPELVPSAIAVAVRILRDVLDFVTVGTDAVTTLSGTDFQAAGVRPGDSLEIFSGGAVTAGRYVVAAVAGVNLTMTRSLAAGLSAGRILRIVR